MIGIAGLARSGKDTLGSCFEKILEDEGIPAMKFSFADPIKNDLSLFLIKKTGLNIFDDSDKIKLRPIIVEYAELMKREFGQDFWLKEIREKISDFDNAFKIFTDVRFDFEIDFLREENDGYIFHIAMEGNYPIIRIEEENDPILREKADIQYLWPNYGVDYEEKAMEHARILWQMIPEEKKEKWKTYNLSKK